MRKSISESELKEAGCLYARTLSDAWKAYEGAVFTAGCREDMLAFLHRVFQENEISTYVDFYYPVFPKEEQEAFERGLSAKERELTRTFESYGGQVHYPADRECLDFLFEVTARNWLFSTFYFTNKKLMVWGNYDLKFPVFCEEEQDLDDYEALAREYRLEIER